MNKKLTNYLLSLKGNKTLALLKKKKTSILFIGSLLFISILFLRCQKEGIQGPGNGDAGTSNNSNNNSSNSSTTNIIKLETLGYNEVGCSEFPFTVNGFGGQYTFYSGATVYDLTVPCSQSVSFSGVDGCGNTESGSATSPATGGQTITIWIAH